MRVQLPLEDTTSTVNAANVEYEGKKKKKKKNLTLKRRFQSHGEMPECKESSVGGRIASFVSSNDSGN